MADEAAAAGAEQRAFEEVLSQADFVCVSIALTDDTRSLIDARTLCAAIEHLAGRDWPADLSGAYAIAQPGPVSLARIVTALRQGMDRPARLMSVPPTLLRMAGRLAGRGRTVESITGDLIVDPARFFSTFQFSPEMTIVDAIAESGRCFRAARGGPAA